MCACVMCYSGRLSHW